LVTGVTVTSSLTGPSSISLMLGLLPLLLLLVLLLVVVYSWGGL
jgi:hypothetical protein